MYEVKSNCLSLKFACVEYLMYCKFYPNIATQIIANTYYCYLLNSRSIFCFAVAKYLFLNKINTKKMISKEKVIKQKHLHLCTLRFNNFTCT